MPETTLESIGFIYAGNEITIRLREVIGVARVTGHAEMGHGHPLERTALAISSAEKALGFCWGAMKRPPEYPSGLLLPTLGYPTQGTVSWHWRSIGYEEFCLGRVGASIVTPRL
jgi:hypothetical protein